MEKLTRGFYRRDPITVAQDLLGKYLVRVVNEMPRVGRIVEVEAYLGPLDLAAHSSKGRTKRTEVLFGEPGHAYVYLIYGIFHCMNVVVGEAGHGCAVLLRALEPVHNISQRTQGPGLLCRALEIDKGMNGRDLVDNGKELYLAAPLMADPVSVVARPRIGVAYAGDWAEKPLRFYIKDNPFISRK